MRHRCPVDWSPTPNHAMTACRQWKKQHRKLVRKPRRSCSLHERGPVDRGRSQIDIVITDELSAIRPRSVRTSAPRRAATSSRPCSSTRSFGSISTPRCACSKRCAWWCREQNAARERSNGRARSGSSELEASAAPKRSVGIDELFRCRLTAKGDDASLASNRPSKTHRMMAFSFAHPGG